MTGVRVGLTAKQQAFAERLAAGDSLSDAYRAAYDADGMKPATIKQRAYELSVRSDIRGTVEALVMRKRAMVVAVGVSERERVTALLRGMALDEDRRDDIRLRAAELWGRAVGAFIDQGEVKRDRSVDAVADELQRRLSMLAEHDVVSVQSGPVVEAIDGPVDDDSAAAGGEGVVDGPVGDQ